MKHSFNIRVSKISRWIKNERIREWINSLFYKISYSTHVFQFWQMWYNFFTYTIYIYIYIYIYCYSLTVLWYHNFSVMLDTRNAWNQPEVKPAGYLSQSNLQTQWRNFLRIYFYIYAIGCWSTELKRRSLHLRVCGSRKFPKSSAQPRGRAYILSSTDSLFRYVRVCVCV